MKTLGPTTGKLIFKGICFWMLFVLTLGLRAQETVPDERQAVIVLKEESDLQKSAAKSTGFKLNVVESDALIHGHTLGRGNTGQPSNTALGQNSLANNEASAFGTSAFGYQTLQFNTTGIGNTAIGSWALLYNTTGSLNTGLGRMSLNYNTSGTGNIAAGQEALFNNRTGNYNTAVGTNSLFYNNTGYGNVAVGVRALFMNSSKSNLVAVGDSALYNNGVGATGAFEGEYNTAVGSKALYSNTRGYSLTAIGAGALRNNTEGVWNTAVGLYALRTMTTGVNNTAIGMAALENVITSNGNTAIGAHAGRYHTTISNGTFIGTYAHPGTNGLINVTAIGYNARPVKNHQMVFGNSSVTENLYYGGWTSGSDARYKKNISEDVVGLDFILKLRPVTYNMDVHKLAALLEEDADTNQDGQKIMKTPDKATLMARDQKSAILYSGFIAQEVEAVAKDVGYDFAGVSVPTDDSGYYALDYISLTVPIVKAIQEQQKQIEALSPEGFKALQEELEELKSDSERMRASDAELRSENNALKAEQTLLKEENEQIRRQIVDILSLLNTYGAELGTLNMDLQQCCGQATGYLPGTGKKQQDASAGQELSDNAKLEQNAPNPFHENTLIRYYLPQETRQARIVITESGGTQVMAFSLEGSGVGQVLVHGGSLAPGIYIYTLIIDGKQFDSKRMVIL